MERVVLFTIEAWDVNCPQHIHRRLSERQTEQLQARVVELEAELERLRAQTDDDHSKGARP